MDKKEELDAKAGLGLAFVIVAAVAIGVLFALVITGGVGNLSTTTAQPAPEETASSEPSHIMVCNACGAEISQTEIEYHMEQHKENGISASYSYYRG